MGQPERLGYGDEARFVNRQMVTVKDLEDEHRNRMTIRASLPLPLDDILLFSKQSFTLPCELPGFNRRLLSF